MCETTRVDALRGCSSITERPAQHKTMQDNEYLAQVFLPAMAAYCCKQLEKTKLSNFVHIRHLNGTKAFLLTFRICCKTGKRYICHIICFVTETTEQNFSYLLQMLTVM